VATKGKVIPMSEQTSNPVVNSQPRLTQAQGMKVGELTAVSHLLSDVAEVFLSSAQEGARDGYKRSQGWTIYYRQSPSPRVEIRIVWPKLYELAHAAFGALGYQVDMDRYCMIVIMPE
jgi:hypothetical protein